MTLTSLLQRVEAAKGPSALLDGMLIAAFDLYDAKSHPGKFWHAVEDWYAAQDEEHIERHYCLRDDGAIFNPDRNDFKYYSSSIDAALALVERLLPGRWWVLNSGIQDGSSLCLIDARKPFETIEGRGAIPSLSILAALLRTLAAQEGMGR